MSIVLALLAACGFGLGDFLAGLAGRRLGAGPVAAIAQALALLAAICAVAMYPGDGPTGRTVLWGAIAGVGNGVGTLLLYHGLTVGRMSIVAVLSGLLTAIIPVAVGFARGDLLSATSVVGIGMALPAIALFSWQPYAGKGRGRSGAIWGLLAGVAFAIFFIGLDQTEADSGAWPVVADQAAAVLVTAPFALRLLAKSGTGFLRPGVGKALSAGLLIGLATIALLSATHSGQLAIVVVLTALYPGVTALLARFVLAERWTRPQELGLAMAVGAVVLIAAGSS